MPNYPTERWLYFSELEESLIEAITDKPGSASEISKRTGYNLSGNLRFALANMVARKILVIGPDGYQINS
jgi:hypothetical protein